MRYGLRPSEEVLSAKKRMGGIIEVIHDPRENGMSVARIIWDKSNRLSRFAGMATAEQPLGNPMSRRHPTWFVVDGYAASSVEQAAREAAERSPNSLTAKYREMASDSERELKAEEWT